MARKYQGSGPSGHTVLVVDDSPDILESTRRLLEAEGHQVFAASDGRAALTVLDRERIALILLDYFMPGMTGEEVVQRIRERDPLVQIILVTGYSGEKPARAMMRQLDIQGYHDKSEGAERLLLWVDAGLRAFRHILAMEKHRVGLRYVLDSTPEMHRMQPLDDLLQGLLRQAEGLLEAKNSFLATFPNDTIDVTDDDVEGFIAVVNGAAFRDASLEIRFGTGRFHPGMPLDALAESDQSLVRSALRDGSVEVENSVSVVPLRLGERPVGIIYVDRRTGYERDRELLELFANQAAAAIQNALLYEMATTDATTGTHLRGFAMQRLLQVLKGARRRAEPTSLLMIDMDRFKAINDCYGHHVGDRALRAVGELLRNGVRDTDIVGRFGGDEFMVILPDTPLAGARIAADRLMQRATALAVREMDELIPLHLSIGIGTLDPIPDLDFGILRGEAFDAIAEGLIAAADRALYRAKGTGEPGESTPLSWTDLLPLSVC
jgi:two-component system cell cycle response regulator